ncbi:MAG: DUF1189 family protein [Nanoarchaeota archaeon]
MIKEIMLKIKDIFIKSLIPSSKFYKTILKKNFNFSLLYFFIFIFILNLLVFSFFVFQINIGLNFNQTINSLETLPKNLIINISGGYLSTNQTRPIMLWKENKKLIAVIDESATNEKINQYKSNVLLTSTNIVINDGLKSYFSVPYTKSDIKITKERITNFKSTILKVIPLIIALASFYFIILNPFFITIFLLVYLSFISLITFLIYKSNIKKITFKKVLQISLHAITLPVIIYVVLMSFNNMLLNILSFYIFLPLSFAFILISVYDTYQ